MPLKSCIQTENLEGAEVAVLCITKSEEVLNHQVFNDAKGIGASVGAEITPVSGNPAAVSTTPTSVSRTNVNVHNQSHKWFDGIDWKRMADSEGALS